MAEVTSRQVIVSNEEEGPVVNIAAVRIFNLPNLRFPIFSQSISLQYFC
jgi:hypothetical protein